MNSILVFNYLNDIIYTKYNKLFATHINDHARSLGLLPEADENESEDNLILSNNVLMQIFSPLVTSQRIMSCQLGNSYTSIKCKEGLNMTFEEFMGYLFISISKEDANGMRKYLNTCVAFVRFLCGPDVHLLKSNSKIANLLTTLIDTWLDLYSYNQAILIEAVEQLIVSPDLSGKIVHSLQDATEVLQSHSDTSKFHAMLQVQCKFLALYSSRNAKELSATDILFLTILTESTKGIVQKNDTINEKTVNNESNGVSINDSEENAIANEMNQKLHTFQVLLNGTEFTPKCVPHTVHIAPIAEGVNLILIIETGNQAISSSMYNVFHTLNVIQNVQLQRDSNTLRPCYESLDICFKKLLEALKKNKTANTENGYKVLSKKWESIRKKYTEFLKTDNDESLLQVESNTNGLIEVLQELLRSLSFDADFLEMSSKQARIAAVSLSEKLKSLNDFVKITSLKNYSINGKDCLTINKYLEEFPGLVHFFYIDRSNHRVTMPTLDFSSEETNKLTKKKIWSMLSFARNHLQEGRLSVMWKDTTFNYAYFLWFEDNSGAPIKPNIHPTNSSKPLPLPGILCGDFYQVLKEVCFPKMIPSKIRCYELMCIHLGLVTAPCVLEQTRRLSATIWELRGQPNHSADLF